jgi:hypothetical protein
VILYVSQLDFVLCLLVFKVGLQVQVSRLQLVDLSLGDFSFNKGDELVVRAHVDGCG